MTESAVRTFQCFHAIFDAEWQNAFYPILKMNINRVTAYNSTATFYIRFGCFSTDLALAGTEIADEFWPRIRP